MAHNFKISILTPTKSAFTGMVSEAIIPGAAGEIGVLPGHRDLIGLLGTGTLKLQSVAGPGSFMVSSGFYEVKDGDLSVLCEIAEEASQIDAGAAAARASQLRQQVERLSAYSPEFENLKQDLAVEEARVKTAKS